MTRDEALDKIKKCLALAASPEAHEAAAALRQAQKLMAQFGLMCAFDVDDADATDRVMEAAAVLATYSTDKPSVRVVKDEAGYPLPLMRWTQDGGWRKA